MKARLTIMVLLAAILVGQLMPMTLMSGPDDPWYTGITSIWFLISAIIYYPATAVALLLRQPIHGVVHWILNLAWLTILCVLVWRLKSKRSGWFRVGLHNPGVEADQGV